MLNMNKKKHIRLGIALIFFVLLAVVFVMLVFQKAERPNVIFILLDAARADHFSCYGYTKNTTPNIDEISQKGAIFLNNFSPDTFTLSSLPKILFSRYFSLPIFDLSGWLWGVRNETPRTVFKKFDDQQILLPEVFSMNGYKTLLFTDNLMFKKDTFLGNKFDEHYYFRRTKKKASDEEIHAKMVSWLETNRKKRFFIYCHIMSPHTPYPEKDEDEIFLNHKRNSEVERVINKLDSRKRLEGKELDVFEALYDSNLRHSDHYIGLLYEKLKNLGLDKKTILVITSDHGENLGEHGINYHAGEAWDSCIHVPLIISYPRLTPAAVKVTGLTESIDIMPTILDICDIELPKNKSMDGVSLLRFARNPQEGKGFVFPKGAVRSERYKYILTGNRLYDLSEDPHEVKNIVKQKIMIKKDLLEKRAAAMKASSDRFESSVREEPPDYPFFYKITDFKISPDDGYQSSFEKEISEPDLKDIAREKPWLLDLGTYPWGLIRVPRIESSFPITLSSDLPNGTYQIFFMIESSGDLPLAPENCGFKYRFSVDEPFAQPKQINFKGNRSSNIFYYYFDLGKTDIETSHISVEIDYSPMSEDMYMIRCVIFIPVIEGLEKMKEDLDEDELKKRMEVLKSLGYIK